MEDHKEPLLPKKSGSKEWVYYTLGAAILFTLCNTALSEVSSLGLEGLLYLSGGPLICGLIYIAYQILRREYWNEIKSHD